MVYLIWFVSKGKIKALYVYLRNRKILLFYLQIDQQSIKTTLYKINLHFFVQVNQQACPLMKVLTYFSI